MTDLPALEREVAARWARSGLVPESLARKATGPSWTCYVEPQSPPGCQVSRTLRVLALADLYPRFKAMQGYDVTVSHGWACHGLGVEIAVARELGLAGQAEVEAYGIEAFAARCRESALRHAELFALLGERLGGLVDPTWATARWTGATSSLSGGRSGNFSTRKCSSLIIELLPIARAARRRSPTTNFADRGCAGRRLALPPSRGWRLDRPATAAGSQLSAC